MAWCGRRIANRSMKCCTDYLREKESRSMFVCLACTRRYFSSVAANRALSATRLQTSTTTTSLASSKASSVKRVRVRTETSGQDDLDVKKRKITRSTQVLAKTDRHLRDARTTVADTAREVWGKNEEEQDRKTSLAQRRRLEYTLKFLVDPLRLSEYVQRQLKKSKLQDALDIVRLASSRQMNATVAWNFVIDWLLKQGKIDAALKIYNEMKKRAQVPDAYTYSILFRGMSAHADRPNAIQKAMSLYNLMNAGNSRVRPGTIHANLMLNMCATAGDMDNLWVIAGKLSDGGSGAADERTYSIILRAELQYAIRHMPPVGEPEQIAAHLAKSVASGRKIWVDIIRRWRKGQMRMDEELIRSMGRILLLSHQPHDWDDVFSLVEQTMNVSRVLSLARTKQFNKSSSFREVDHSGSRGNSSTTEKEVEDGELTARNNEFSSEAVAADHTTKEVSGRAKGNQTLRFAKPGRATLSLLMEACLKFCSRRVAEDYWSLLTSTKYGVEPDHDNYKTYLRVLRQSRSSAQATKLLSTQCKGANISHDLFRLSIAACVRDKLNKNAFDHATELMHVMRTRGKSLDPVSMSTYLRLATDSGIATRVEQAVLTIAQLAREAASTTLQATAAALQSGTLSLEKAMLESFWLLCNDVIRSIDWLLEHKPDVKEDRATWMTMRAEFKSWSKVFGAAAGRQPVKEAVQARGRRLPHLHIKNVGRTFRVPAESYARDATHLSA